MSTRRQEKVAKLVRQLVSEAVNRGLNDPRIAGFISVTRVEVAPDLRSAGVYLSIFGGDEASQKRTFAAIIHARNKIQSLVAAKLQCKFCPILRFHSDDKLKKEMNILNLMDTGQRGPGDEPAG
jgi:ribosome-binding factor A